MEILKGADVTNPIGDGNKIVAHCCNDKKLMGRGVAKALFMKWPSVRSEYMDMESHDLGEVGMVCVEPDVIVANMIGQHDIRPDEKGSPPVRYFALRNALETVKENAEAWQASVHIPYLMGCDLAGGRWEVVEEIIEETFAKTGIDVYIYDLFNKSAE